MRRFTLEYPSASVSGSPAVIVLHFPLRHLSDQYSLITFRGRRSGIYLPPRVGWINRTCGLCATIDSDREPYGNMQANFFFSRLA
jgi:hypothetical protein